MVRLGFINFQTILMRAFYQVAKETTERSEVLEYVHATLREEDNSNPSIRRIFDADSFAGLSGRGNPLEERFYKELCSSNMFTQFVCDRVVFGVRALFDHFVARKIVRVVEQYRARMEQRVQSWFGLLYRIPGFNDEDEKNQYDHEADAAETVRVELGHLENKLRRKSQRGSSPRARLR